MTISRKIILPAAFFTLLLPCLAFSAEANLQRYFGSWSLDCNKPVVLNFSKEKSAILTVNNNQIYIEVSYRDAGESGLDIFYMQPEELGVGGSEIDWDDISTVAKIGSFSVVGDKVATLSWFGFLNKKTGKRVLVKDPEFVSGAGQIKLIDCK